MTTINLLFALDLVTALLEGGEGRLEVGKLEAENNDEAMDNVADEETATSLLDKVFTEDKDNVCG